MVVRVDPFMLNGATVEPINHDHKTGLGGGIGEDIGALEALRLEAEHVVDVEYPAVRCLWASDIYSVMS